MKARIYVKSNKNENWFDEAYKFSLIIFQILLICLQSKLLKCVMREISVKLMVNNVYKI